MKLEHLKKLAEIIENTPDDEVDMGEIWIEHPCGSIGCALGHAANDPYFNRLGLTYEPGGHYLRVWGISKPYWVVAQDIFDISETVAFDLFGVVRSWTVKDGLTDKQVFLKRVKNYV